MEPSDASHDLRQTPCHRAAGRRPPRPGRRGLSSSHGWPAGPALAGLVAAPGCGWRWRQVDDPTRGRGPGPPQERLTPSESVGPQARPPSPLGQALRPGGPGRAQSGWRRAVLHRRGYSGLLVPADDGHRVSAATTTRWRRRSGPAGLGLPGLHFRSVRLAPRGPGVLIIQIGPWKPPGSPG